MWTDRLRDVVRARIAGAEAMTAVAAAEALFRTAGHRVLPAGAREVVRVAVDEAGRRSTLLVTPLLGAPAAFAERSARMIGAGASQTARTLAKRAASRGMARAATVEVAKGVGRAAGIGFLFDGSVAAVEGALAVRRGAWTPKQAVKHAMTEGATGAVATGVAVAVVSSVVAVSGSIAAPVAFALAAGSSIGMKSVLRSFTKPAEIEARVLPLEAK